MTIINDEYTMLLPIHQRSGKTFRNILEMIDAMRQGKACAYYCVNKQQAECVIEELLDYKDIKYHIINGTFSNDANQGSIRVIGVGD